MKKPVVARRGLFRRTLLATSALLGIGALEVRAQQTTGTPGSPSATTTIPNTQLPPPDPAFGGVIKDGALQSTPWWAPRVVPPKDAPNVLLIITDDAGFGVPSTFGGVIPTPAMDRIAREGLRYNRMFSTALCSPTRAALLTGRNHHSAGFGVISEQSTGYEKLRERIFENQKRLGVIPKDARLPPWPKDMLKPWDELTADEKKLFIRQVEVFAAYAAYSDHEIGRVIQAFEDQGRLDNTLVIYINGDNGTSAEGGPLGTPNEVAFFNGVTVPVEAQMKWYDVWGTEQTYNHMSAGWSWAFDTPFDWFKQNASRLGGINQNMVVSWPKRIKDKGALREQFVHVIDVVPTILEAAGLRAPETVDGIAQKPIEGTSFLYTFDAANAKAPSRHTTQYFEMMGQWALYDEGWLLSTKVNRAPWEAFGPANPDPLNNQEFQLYNLATDFNQTNDVAAQNPQKVAALRAKFLDEAKKYQVLPLDASVAARIVAPRPNITAGRSEFVYTRPMVGLPQGDSPNLLNTSYTITADVTVPQGGGEGMILTSGGRFAGYGFYLLKGKPVFLWNLIDLERLKWEGADALTPGRHTLEFDFKYDGLGVGTLAFNNFSGVGRPGTGTLKVDGKVVATRKMERTLPMILQWDESFDIGSDTLTGVNDNDYKPPFPLTATLHKLIIKVDRPVLTREDEQKLKEAAARAGDSR